MELYYWNERTEIDINFWKSEKIYNENNGRTAWEKQKIIIKWGCKCGRAWTIGIRGLGGRCGGL